MTRPSPIPSAGFTLIELLCVLAMVGVLSAIAMPVYQQAQSTATRQSGFGEICTMAGTSRHGKRQLSG